MQYYFLQSSLDTWDVFDHKLWPKAEFIILVDAMTKGLASLSDTPCKTD